MRKITASLLLAALLLSLAACGSGTTTETDSGADTMPVPETESVTETEEETRPMHQVAKTDYEGAAFNIAYPEWQGYLYYFFADESNGDAMNDAIYDRTIRVEEYLNVDLTQEAVGYIFDVAPAITRSVSAGDDIYALSLFHCIAGVKDMVTTGALYNLDDLPNTDLDAAWWNRAQMDALRLGKKTYFGVSDYMIPCPYAIFFNKEIITDYGMDDPYTLVYEGNWTLDKMLGMATSFTNDLNGDGAYTREDDNCGLSATEISKYSSLMTSCGQFLTEKGQDGRIRIAVNTEKMYSLVEKLSALVSTPGAVFEPAAETPETEQFDFNSGRLLFRMDTIANAILFRDYETDIGILPYPKFDSTQEDYISLDWGGLMGVPVTIKNPGMVGAVLELLAYESAETVIPAYYDKLLSGKLARDENSVAMMDLLFDTIAYDVGMNYFGFDEGNFGDLLYTLGRMVVLNKTSDFASWYAKREAASIATIDKFYKVLDQKEAE